MDFLLSYVARSDIMVNILVSFVFWNVINLIVFALPLPDKNLKRADYLDMRNRITSFFHGSVTMVLSGYHMYFVHSECGQSNSGFEEFILINSTGYFLYDFFAMAYLRILDFDMTIHHMMCVMGMYSCLLLGDTGFSPISGLFVTEISNPIMHVRMVIKHLGKRYTKAYELAELSYIRKFNIFFLSHYL